MAAAAMLNLLSVYFLTHFEDYEDKMRGTLGPRDAITNVPPIFERCQLL